MCYEWYSQGPCGDSFLFRFNKETGKTECVCDEDEGYVFWNETKKCYRVYTKGPCPAHAWLIPSEEEDADGRRCAGARRPNFLTTSIRQLTRLLRLGVNTKASLMNYFKI